MGETVYLGTQQVQVVGQISRREIWPEAGTLAYLLHTSPRFGLHFKSTCTIDKLLIQSFSHFFFHRIAVLHLIHLSLRLYPLFCSRWGAPARAARVLEALHRP